MISRANSPQVFSTLPYHKVHLILTYLVQNKLRLLVDKYCCTEMYIQNVAERDLLGNLIHITYCRSRNSCGVDILANFALT